MSSKVRDIVIIAAIAGLALLALLPGAEQKRGSSPRAPEAPADVEAEEERETLEAADVEAGRETAREPGGEDGDRLVAEPLEEAGHELFPLVRGSEWEYRTVGSRKLVPAERCVLKLVTLPSEAGPGVLGVRWGERRFQLNVWLKNGALRLDGLPLWMPLQFGDARPRTVSGAFLPPRAAVVRDAVWEQKLGLEVDYTLQGGGGRVRRVSAEQKDRARVEGWETVVVPGGAFEAARLEWSSRVEIVDRGRVVLDQLTAEPFRSEIMWVVPGIGVVKRHVIWGDPGAGDSLGDGVSFELVRYERPAGAPRVGGKESGDAALNDTENRR
ncbi:MAG: hypothetical protein R6V85_20780 [Polyangia bacterium]